MEVIESFVWLVKQWWFWTIFTGTSVVWYFLINPRYYRMINKELYVRHGRFGKWIKAEEHLKKDHKEN